MPSKEILEKYDDVRSSLENAIATSDDMKIYGDEENVELAYIRTTLSHLNEDFKTEIERLESSSEWDRFCMAFFGETNAGKSTIIEALRIVYDEETRRAEIGRQSEQYNTELSHQNAEYSKLVETLKQLNDSLAEPPKRITGKDLIKYVGLVTIGFVIGFVVALFLF